MVYLDHAAATPVDERVLAAMHPYWQDNFYNPSALYTAARAVRKDVDALRRRCGSVLGVKPRDVYFTAGATEANNAVIAGVMQHFPRANMVISTIEHESVRRPARTYASPVEVGVQADGRVNVEDVASCVTPDTALISMEYANSEIGVVQPVRDIARWVSEIRAERTENGNATPLYLHTDASQATGRVPVDLAGLGVDMATINGAKIYGPKQSAVLYIRSGVELAPFLYGGGQEGGIRSGTENVAFAAGLATALELAEDRRSDERRRLRPLQKRLIECAEQLDGVLNGSRRHRTPDNVNVSFPGVDGETLVHHMDARHIQAATGSACSANQDTPDHVLVALGCEDAHINGSLRMTLGKDTTEDDITYVTGVLEDRIPKLRES